MTGQYVDIFQSTHPRRVRPSTERLLWHHSYFNPRTREGCDILRFFRDIGKHHFNPRTREGCDSALLKNCSLEPNFNPRTREGCDSPMSPTKPPSAVFQSTHPRRVRHRHKPLHRQYPYFNPRTREGCDSA